MREIIISEPTRLDSVVFRHYGTLEVFARVLEANTHLLSSFVLVAGDRVFLPMIEIKKVSKRGALWD